MPKFGGKKKKETPGVSTASLPDIVFMLLFFFMVATVMKDNDTIVKVKLPKASEITKLKHKNKVQVINIGVPSKKYQAKYGDASRIQLNDVIANKEDVREWVNRVREEMPEKLKKQMIMALKIDHETKMGVVSDVKQELRKANALKINYSSLTGAIEE